MTGGTIFYIYISAAALALFSFAISFICGFMHVLGFRGDEWPERGGRGIVFGLLFLVFSLIAGSWWRYLTWGWCWAWEREEVWFLMVGLIYGAILYLEFGSGWSRGRLAWAEILAFLGAVFSLLSFFF